MNRRIMVVVASGLMVGAGIAACYTSPEGGASTGGGGGTNGQPSAPSGCTTTIASIQEKLFTPKCATAGCHTAAKPASGLDLASPGVEARLVGSPSTCSGTLLVAPGSPETSLLVDKVSSESPACGGSRMPIGSVLEPGDVACMTGWITALPIGSGGDGGGVDAGPTVACGAQETACGDVCIDTSSDATNCGACGKTCGGAAPFCVAGACSAVCPTLQCAGACVDTATDPNNCGGCGTKCTGGKVCVGGSCTCGPTTVTLSSLQTSTFTPSCVGAGCHSKTGPKAAAEGLDLSSSALSFGSLVGVASSTCAGKTRVVAGDATASYLINKVTGVGMCAGGSKMPKGTSLPASRIDGIRNWICNGAKND